MNLLVLATGGTIGSAPKGTGLDTDAAQTPLLLQMYRRQYGEHARFTVRQLCAVLSENIEDSFYETLCTALCAPETARFDGVIVLHGTDTLPYTAALCAMACRQLCVPVCFVSSAYVLTDPRQNGLLNLRAAVRYIEAGGAGFAVPFHNTGDTTELHLATRLLEADPFTDRFSSAADAPLAVLCGDEIRFSASPQLPTQEELRIPLRVCSEAPPVSAKENCADLLLSRHGAEGRRAFRRLCGGASLGLPFGHCAAKGARRFCRTNARAKPRGVFSAGQACGRAVCQYERAARLRRAPNVRAHRAVCTRTPENRL